VRKLDVFLAVSVILLGLGCLVTVTAGLAEPNWVAPPVREFLLTWTPLVTLGLLGVLAIALKLPSAEPGIKALQQASVIALVSVAAMVILWWPALREVQAISLLGPFRR
jgi:hypothetical protein